MQNGNTNRPDKSRKRLPELLLAIIILAAAFSAAWFLLHRNRPAPLPPEAQTDPQASFSIVDSDPASIPEYSGEDVIELNFGKPGFSEYDISTISGENFSELDELGRCGTAFAMLSREMMPEEEREMIGDFRPTGWVQAKYPGVVDSEPPYLYNRCHLIAYAMTGQGANELNLITGTRYMNATTMLPYEEIVLRYLDSTDNHVLYRVSPYFKDYELLARGVEIEAYSVEDEGLGVRFHVFIYNVQPGVNIDYQTGSSSLDPEK